MKIIFSGINTFSPKSSRTIRVTDKLIRGRSVSNPIKIYMLKKHGVKQIIDLRNPATERTQILPMLIERFLCKLFNIKYINLRYSHKMENLPDTSFFANINNLILQNSGQTYIHCRHGKRRTGVCVAIHELFNTDKNKKEILKNLYNRGFQELNLKQNTKKYDKIKKRLMNIYNNFIDKYCTEYTNYKINI